jgi:hypothetical protein
MNRGNGVPLPRGLALAAALAALPVAAAETAALHAAIQGRWRADNKQVAAQAPGWKDMTPAQRQKVLAVIPPLNFEITSDRIVWKATGPDEQDDRLTYTITGVDGRTLKLNGKNADGEQKAFTIEVLGPDALALSSAEAPSLRLDRVGVASPSPSPPTSQRP